MKHPILTPKRGAALALFVGASLLGTGVLAAPLDRTPTPSEGMFHPKRLGPVPEAPASKPFAEHHIVFQISDGEPETQNLVLNNMRNVMSTYGDKATVEVVAYGPGLRLLFEENEHSKRIREMASNGATFSACANTMRGMGRSLDMLNPSAKVVEGGIIRINELSQAGWTVIRP